MLNRLKSSNLLAMTLKNVVSWRERVRTKSSLPPGGYIASKLYTIEIRLSQNSWLIFRQPSAFTCPKLFSVYNIHNYTTDVVIHELQIPETSDSKHALLLALKLHGANFPVKYPVNSVQKFYRTWWFVLQPYSCWW
jgi:hypothetical protein